MKTKTIDNTNICTSYLQPKWLTGPKIKALSQPGPHIL